MVGSRDTPKDVQEGPYGYQPGSGSRFIDDQGDAQRGRPLPNELASKLARECYESSTNWINAGKRARWTESLRAFQNLHPIDSKYYSRDYGYRTTLYRPKTRAMIRKAEAATASAFFSNEDVARVEAADEDSPQQAAAAQLKQQLLQYRLTNSEAGIPWFLTVVGARQDCEVMGVCCAYAYWKRETRPRIKMVTRLDDMGQPETDDDGNNFFDERQEDEVIWEKPVVDLIPPENLRIEVGADWRSVIQSSPYVIHQVPMYLSDILDLMETGQWHRVAVGTLRASQDLMDTQTRRTREAGRVPGKEHDAWKPREYDIVWVHNNIMRWGGQDWQYYSVGLSAELLTDPRPINEVYLHGQRPFVCGFTVLETHKTYPSSKIELIRDLQRATNDDWNLRFDQLKLSLNPRQFIRQGAGLEVVDVRTFMPGKVLLSKNPKEDVVWDRPPPPVAEAYGEQDRINLDWDELAGDYSNTSVQSAQLAQQSATGMHLMSGMASGLNEYELRMFSETFVEPLLRLILKLEEAYETDPVTLAIAGRKAELVEKFGVNEITDQLLAETVQIKVNAGIGATNPSIKLRQFVGVGQVLGQMMGPVLAQGLNFEEVIKELFSLAGYKDGMRFFRPGFDFAQAVEQSAQQHAQGKQGQRMGAQPDPYRLEATQVQAQARLQEAAMRAQAEAQQEQAETARTQMGEQAETFRALLQLHGRRQEAADRHQATLARQAQAQPPAPFQGPSPLG